MSGSGRFKKRPPAMTDGGRRAAPAKKESQSLLEQYILKEHRKKNILRLAAELIGTVAVVFILFQVVAGIAVVRGTSMEPTITNGSLAVFYRLDSHYKKNDVVLFRSPVENELLIKRVAAVAGDRVDIDDRRGVLLVNGVVQKSDTAVGKTYTRQNGVEFPLTVPNDCVFVLGDHRETALDSRNLGTISDKRLVGKVVLEARRLTG